MPKAKIIFSTVGEDSQTKFLNLGFGDKVNDTIKKAIKQINADLTIKDVKIE